MGEKIINLAQQQIFEKYYTRYYPEITKYICSKISSYHMAEDIAMDCFTVCWNKFEQFDSSKASFQTWLYVIVNNRLKNYYRDKKDITDIDENLDDNTSFENDIDEAEYLSYMRNQLASALESLPEKQRHIIVCKYFKNMKSTEIAETLGISSGNVRIQIFRATENLKKYFEENDIRWE